MTDVDTFAVQLVLDGTPMNLTGIDLEAAAIALADAGHGPVVIAVRCRVSERPGATGARRGTGTAEEGGGVNERREHRYQGSWLSVACWSHHHRDCTSARCLCTCHADPERGKAAKS